MPSVDELNKLMMKLSIETTPPGQLNVYRYLWDRVGEHLAAPLSNGARPVPSRNYELVLGEMTALGAWLTPAPLGTAFRSAVGYEMALPRVSGAKPLGDGPPVRIHWQLAEMVYLLAYEMRNRCQRLKRNEEAFQSYSRLMSAIRDAFVIGVYNLNYDNVAVSAMPGPVNGFRDDGRFDPRIIHRERGWNFIYHLHGSVHYHLKKTTRGPTILWKWDLDKVTDGHFGDFNQPITDDKIYQVTTLIAGGFKLNQLLIEPYHSMHALLVRHVFEADAILICGYGFGDTHVNYALRGRCLLRDRPNVVVLDRSRPSQHAMCMRRDYWSYAMCQALAVTHDCLKREGQSGPQSRTEDTFEISQDRKVALWLNGFLAEESRVGEIIGNRVAMAA